MAIITHKTPPPDGYYWWIPGDLREEEQPVQVTKGDVLGCGSDIEIPHPDGVYIPLNSENVRKLQ